MLQAFKITLILSVCYYSAYFVLARLTPYGERLRRYFFASILIIAVTVFTRSVLIGYLATFFVSLHFGSKFSPSERVALFFGLAFTLPFTDGIHLSPGLDLGALNYKTVLTFSLLLPMLFSQAKERGIKGLNAIDKAVILYFVWMLLVNFRYFSITAILRSDFWLAIHTVIPYLAIRFFAKDYGLLFASIAFALFAQSAVGVVEAILGWHVYTDLQSMAGFSDAGYIMYKYRYGFLRAQGSFMNPLIFALFANMAFVCAIIYFSKIGRKETSHHSKFMAFAILGLTTLGSLAPGSRAAILGIFLSVAIGVIVLWVVKRKQDPLKILLFWGSIFGVCIVVYGVTFVRQNFGYRVSVFEVSTDVILASPMFGYINPQYVPGLQVLMQGEGIVDLVNAYVGIALSYGLPALFLFVFAIFACLYKLYSCLRICKGELLTICAFAFVSTCLITFSLATTSVFDWTAAWWWIGLAMGSNIVARVQSQNKTLHINQTQNL